MSRWPSLEEDDARIFAALSHSERTHGRTHPSPVPAVERAIAILRLLERSVDPASCTVSAISRLLDMNKSTCSNILRTLEAGGMVQYDSRSRAYSLGVGLIGLSLKARHRPFPSVATDHMRALVQEIGFTCVAFERLPNGEFIIVAKVESQKDIKVTIDVGQRFPPAAPVFARIAMAWSSPDQVASFIARGDLRSFTKLAKAEPEWFAAELQAIRRRGYTVSIGEYYLANTAIAAPVFSLQQDVCRGVCMVGFSTEVPEEMLPVYGEAVGRTGRAITKTMRTLSD